MFSADIIRGLNIVFFFQAEDGIRDHCVTGFRVCSSDLWGDDHASHVDRHDLVVLKLRSFDFLLTTH